MKIIIQNLATEYHDEGAGSVMLLLHGWQDNLHTFDSLVPFLSPARRIIRIDLPGFGASEAPKETWNLDNYVRFVKDFVAKLNIKVEVLVGHSFGGRIVIKGQAAEKLRANKIVLIDAAGVARSRRFRKSVFKALAKIGGVLAYLPPLVFWRKGLRKKMYDLIGSDYQNAGALQATFLEIVAEDLSSSAEEITSPTLLIWGASDRETPLIEGQRLAGLIRGAKLRVLSGAGHFVHREFPREVAELIRGFL